jgi:predicted histidine transporter YuiF (NhaC family)
MPISFLTTAPLIVSVITNLTVEGIKKLLDGTKVKYSSNVLAAILSVLIACAVSVIYLIMTDTVFTMKIVVLMYLGFLISTVGYDKVIQMLKQIQSVKEETKNE